MVWLYHLYMFVVSSWMHAIDCLDDKMILVYCAVYCCYCWLYEKIVSRNDFAIQPSEHVVAVQHYWKKQIANMQEQGQAWMRTEFSRVHYYYYLVHSMSEQECFVSSSSSSISIVATLPASRIDDTDTVTPADNNCLLYMGYGAVRLLGCL